MKKIRILLGLWLALSLSACTLFQNFPTLPPGWTVTPSQTNFLFARCPHGNAGEIYRALKRQKILVRFFDTPGLDDKLRISIGTAAQNDALLAALPA